LDINPDSKVDWLKKLRNMNTDKLLHYNAKHVFIGVGQRVQIIKEEEGGVLEFGTDVVHSKDGSITTLLGASPGASTAVNIMPEVSQHAFPEKLPEMIPFWNNCKAPLNMKLNLKKFKRSFPNYWNWLKIINTFRYIQKQKNLSFQKGFFV
jgi:L-2-hydroxyglutarate oxidase LhgO